MELVYSQTSRTGALVNPPDLRPQLSKDSAVDDMGRTYQTFSRQLLTTADGVHSEGHVSLNVVNLQHMLSLGGIDTRFIKAEHAASYLRSAQRLIRLPGMLTGRWAKALLT